MSTGSLTTARLHLRPLTRDDLPLFRALYGNKETMRHIGKPLAPVRAPASLRATVNASGGPGDLQFFVIQQRRGRDIGLCSIRPTAEIHYHEIGIMLLREARRFGYAIEALSALIDEAFETLPITAVSVQYRPANASMAGVCDRLGFALPLRPRKSGRYLRILRRSQWRRQIHQPAKGKTMSNVIGFLEQAGRNATLRHASREQLLRAMGEGEMSREQQHAMLQPQRSALDALLGARETMYCINQKIEPPKKKKAPAKKKQAPKKAPAKKPAKKAPAKRKR